MFWEDIQRRYGQLFRAQVRFDLRTDIQQRILEASQRRSAIAGRLPNTDNDSSIALAVSEETIRMESAALQGEHGSSIYNNLNVQLHKKVFSSLTPTEQVLWD